MIIVTRPSPYGEELVQLCHQAKFAAKYLPFFNIVKGHDLDNLQHHLDSLQQGDIVIIVSPQVNLMIGALQTKIKFPNFVQYFAVGQQTAKQFQMLSNQLVAYPPQHENSEGLVEYFQSIDLCVIGRQVLVLCGDIGRTFIQESLHAQGALIKNIKCYHRKKIDYPSTLFFKQEKYCFVITSIEHLLQLELYCSDMHKHNCCLIVSSTRIMTAAKLHHWRHIYLADNANNQNLFKTIATLCHNATSI